MTIESRFDRQLLLFGEEGQNKLRATDVTVVGVGGLGSHIVQQLVLLGVGGISVIDNDIVTRSSLNRLVGVQHDDPDLKTPKVEVARRHAAKIDPSLKVRPIQEDLLSIDSFEAVKNAGFVFGCVDNDGPRLILTELCAAYRKPYIDLATEIPKEFALDFGGRVCFSNEGEGCLMCLDLLSEGDIKQYLSSPEQRRDVEALYGVPQTDANATGPSVVTLNGIIASLGANEFMLHTTGLRRARRLLIYHGRDGKVTINTDQPNPDCFYCKAVYGAGPAAFVERYLRQAVASGGDGKNAVVGAR